MPGRGETPQYGVSLPAALGPSDAPVAELRSRWLGTADPPNDMPAAALRG